MSGMFFDTQRKDFGFSPMIA